MQRRGLIEAQREHGNRGALDAIIVRKLEIDAMLQWLTEFSADHFGVEPDKVDGGHVGTLSHHAQVLRDFSDSAFQEGEYAA
jgi:hypothetical protein